MENPLDGTQGGANAARGANQNVFVNNTGTHGAFDSDSSSDSDNDDNDSSDFDVVPYPGLGANTTGAID